MKNNRTTKIYWIFIFKGKILIWKGKLQKKSDDLDMLPAQRYSENLLSQVNNKVAQLLACSPIASCEQVQSWAWCIHSVNTYPTKQGQYPHFPNEKTDWEKWCIQSHRQTMTWIFKSDYSLNPCFQIYVLFRWNHNFLKNLLKLGRKGNV